MAKPSTKKQDALIGQQVRINPNATAPSGAAHPFAGQQGTVLTRNTGGNYQVQVKDAIKVVHISDLIPLVDTTDATAQAQQPTLVLEDPALVVASLTNPRRRRGLDVDSIAALAANIKLHSQLQAIVVRPLPAHRLADTAAMQPRPVYEVVAGERRWRACAFAGLKVLMLVRDMTDHAVLEAQLVENVEREDLDPMEEAEGFELMRTRLGFTVDQIAERLGHGKGKSYVYKALKLCALVPAAREAMYPAEDGKPAVLSRSTGLLVARYRPEQQPDVVAYIASLAGPGGEPAAYRDVAAKLAKRYHLELAHAVFDVASTALLPAAGACTACPKRTAAQAEIFDDALAGPDCCTDADCFDAKRQAHLAELAATAKAKGIKVIEGDDALRARPSPTQKHITGYVRLTDVAHSVRGDDGKERAVTFADTLAALGKKAPKPRLFIDPHTARAEKVIPVDLAEKMAAAQEPAKPRVGGAAAAPAASVSLQPAANPAAAWPFALVPNEPEDDNRPLAEVAINNYHVARAVLLRMFEAIRSRPRTLEETRLIGQALLNVRNEDCPRELPEYLGWGNPDETEMDGREWDAMVSQQLGAMPREQLEAVVTMAAVEVQMGSPWMGDDQAVALAEAYGIDVLAVRDKVAEDLERGQDKAVAAEAGGGE